jgi:hypothetical protein
MDTEFKDSRESTESETSGYRSRFCEHLSQAYSAYPPDWPVSYVPRSQPPSNGRTHKTTPSTSPSIESFASSGSIKSTSSSSSFKKLRNFVLRPRSSESQLRRKETSTLDFRIKGSSKTFRKEDIKLGALTDSSNLWRECDE